MGEIKSSRNSGEQLTRVGIIRYAVIFGFVALIVSFWYLQVAQHARFLELAENNHRRARTSCSRPARVRNLKRSRRCKDRGHGIFINLIRGPR